MTKISISETNHFINFPHDDYEKLLGILRGLSAWIYPLITTGYLSSMSPMVLQDGLWLLHDLLEEAKYLCEEK